MNLFTLISVAIILFSQLLLFFFVASESGGLWGAFGFCLLIFLIGAVMCIFSLFGVWLNKKHLYFTVIAVLLIFISSYFASLFIRSSYRSIDHTLRREGKYVLSEKPEQKFFDENKTVSALEGTLYVYWVHLKDQFENDCCVVNPSPQTTDQFYIFSTKSGTDLAGYVGVVCSPDCGQGKVIWQGDVNFTDGFLKLTPTGPAEFHFDELFENKTEVWEAEIYVSGCKAPSCLVTKKTFSSYITLKLEENNLQPYFEYDVYLCQSSCSKNTPYWLFNPQKCKPSEMGLFISTKSMSCF